MIIIQGGTIHDGLGNVEQGDILIKDGRIAALGAAVDAGDALVIDARGREVFPGFIDPLSTWGCLGRGMTDNDLNEYSDPVTPELDAAFAFDAMQMAEQKLWQYGISCCGIVPTAGNVLGGRAAVVKSWAAGSDAWFVRRQAVAVASVSEAPKRLYGARPAIPMTKMGIFSLLRQAFIKARDYGSREKADFDAKSAALQPVLAKEMPLFVHCQTKAEMDGAAWALTDFDMRLCFTGAYGVTADTAYDIILGDLTGATSPHNGTVDFVGLQAFLASGGGAALSSAAEYPGGRETLLWNAMLCVQNGIDPEAVLPMITSVPARLLNVADRVGALAVGRDADIMLWSAHPLQRFDAVVEKAFIGGREVPSERGTPACC